MSVAVPYIIDRVIANIAIQFDDIAALAKPAVGRLADATKIAAGAMDDTVALAKPALSKTSAVVVDDLAVASKKTNDGEISQDREYPVWRKLVLASLANKALIQSVIMISSVTFPVVPKVMLALGGCYLALEGGHKAVEYAHHVTDSVRERLGLPPKEREPAHPIKEKKSENLRPQAEGKPGWLDRFWGCDPKERAVLKDLVSLDMILSTEILLVAMGTMPSLPLAQAAFVLATVGAATTALVYGTVLGIIRTDNVAEKLVKQERFPVLQKVGRGMTRVLPHALKLVGVVGTFAMLGVGGEIIEGFVPAALSAAGAEGAAHAFHAGVSSAADALGFLPFGAQGLVSSAIGLVAGLGLVKPVHMAGQAMEKAKEKIRSFAPKGDKRSVEKPAVIPVTPSVRQMQDQSPQLTPSVGLSQPKTEPRAVVNHNAKISQEPARPTGGRTKSPESIP